MLCQRGLSPPHCLSKVKTLNPRVFALTRPGPPEGSYLVAFLLVAHLVLLLAGWHLDGHGPCLVGFLLVAKISSLEGDPPWAWSVFNSMPSCGSLARGPPPHKLPKTARFLEHYTKNLAAPGPPPIFPFLGRLVTFTSISSCGFRSSNSCVCSKHKRFSIIPMAPAEIFARSTNDLRSYP